MQPTTKKDVQQHTDKAKDSMHTAADAAKDAASHVGQAASSAASTVGKKADEWTNAAGKKAEEWTASAGSKVESLADTIRDKGPSGQGMLGRANEAVASTVERTGEYLQDKNLHGMMNDMTDLIKRNPLPALFVGLGVGYLLGRAMRS
jgi:ElaB/YqjD/DUF883 family membrane-anchored ribosome-binding protein